MKTSNLHDDFGWEDWTLLISGIVAVAIALLDFAQIITLDTPTALKLIMIAVGLLLGSVVAQRSKKNRELSLLLKSMATPASELTHSKKEFQNHVKQSIYQADHFVLHTMLNSETAQIVHPSEKSDFSSALYDRLIKREIGYRRVEVILNQQRLEYVIYRLLVHQNTDYLVRYFPSSATRALPVLNLLSIDNKIFYLGGYYTSDAPVDAWNAAIVKDPVLGTMLESYWSNMWVSAKPLNEAGKINWDTLRTLGSELGLDQTAFDEMLDRVKELPGVPEQAL